MVHFLLAILSIFTLIMLCLVIGGFVVMVCNHILNTLHNLFWFITWTPEQKAQHKAYTQYMGERYRKSLEEKRKEVAKERADKRAEMDLRRATISRAYRHRVITIFLLVLFGTPVLIAVLTNVL